MMSKQSLFSLFNRLEKQRKSILLKYDSLTPEQRQFKPGPDKWNLLQVLFHLIVAEKHSLFYIQRKINNHDLVSESGFGSTLRSFILKLALWIPVKYRAPKIAEVNEDYPDYDSMRVEWDSIRAGIRSIIHEHDEKILKKELYKHPIAGKLNLKQALGFFESHISHHQKQMDRIIKHPVFPL